ncbi:MAG TPA: 5-formyltetrahydrofolate cyclo-ligase [Dermatophilaceae bacterium]|nr:5-formyltetrahydrofolate cyclo-ligase [Dermatophilaceae bacterium]
MPRIPGGHAPQTKPALRRQVREARRRRLATADRAAEARAVAAAVLDAFDPGLLVAAYEALPTEPPTDALVQALLARGVRVVVPLLLADLDLDWRLAGGSAALGVHAVGDARLVIVPALAVDTAGTRLGQGGGSYDRALARRSPAATVVAVVNDEEYVEGPLPREPHDARVDAVVTTGGAVHRTGQPG